MRVAVLFGVILGSTVGFAACGSNDDRSAPVVSSTMTATTVAATTTLAPTTVAPTTTWDRRAKPPLIEGEVDWSAVPIIVTYKPKTSEEQAIVDAMGPILRMDFEFANSMIISPEEEGVTITPEYAAELRQSFAQLLEERQFAVPSVRDRYVIEAVAVVEGGASVHVCHFSGGTVFRKTEFGRSIVLDEIDTYKYAYELLHDGERWLVGNGRSEGTDVGVDTCVG